MNPAKSRPATGFSGKAVLVTGGTSGIGRATAAAFIRAGAMVAFCGLDAGEGRTAERELARKGGAARFFQADVRKPEAMEKLVGKAVSCFGGLDIAFNNAGINHPPALMGKIPAAMFEDVIATNLFGVVYAMRAELKMLAARGGGCIINMASILGSRTSRWMAAYSASKAAVISLTRNAAEDYRNAGIRIYAISPGSVATPMYEKALREIANDPERYAGGLPKGGRPLSAAEVAGQVLRLADAGTAPETGTNLVIPGRGGTPFSS